MMKKEITAICILVFLLAAVIFNLHTIHTLTEDLESSILETQRMCSAGQWQQASDIYEDLSKTWTGARGYTHIFLRYTDTEKFEEALSDYNEAILSQDLSAAESSSQALIGCLKAVYAIERIRLGSIL